MINFIIYEDDKEWIKEYQKILKELEKEQNKLLKSK